MQQSDVGPSPASDSSGALRFAGLSALIGAVVMVTGAILWQVSGTDLDAALAAGDMAGYLADAAGNGLVVANLVAWIVGVFFIGAGGIGFARAPGNSERPAQLARVAFATAVPLAIASFVAWLAVVTRIPADASAAELAVADVVGFFASRADWTATVLIVGLGPFLVSLAGRDTWVPSWLFWIGVLAALGSVGTVIAMFTGALSSYGFLVVPFGLVWTISAGVVTLRG